MLRVIIESPLSAPTREGIERNKQYARLAMRDSLDRGEAPFASHLLYDQPELLDDLIPAERVIGMKAGLAWYAVADLIAVYRDLGITSGMAGGIYAGIQQGIRIELRSLSHD